MREVREVEASYHRTGRSEADLSELTVEELVQAISIYNFMKIGRLVESKATPEDRDKLVEALSTNEPFTWSVAMRGLEALGEAQPFYTRFIDQGIQYIETMPEETGPHVRRRTAIMRILKGLPPEMTLPLARRWFGSTNWHKHHVAEDLLEENATLDDLAMVRAALTQYLEENPRSMDTYETCSLLDILALFPDIGLIPDVEKVFLQTGYAPARRRAANDMQANTPTYFAQTYAYECLWDCDQETRQIGCESVALPTPGALERLRELAEDALEHDAVREEAVSRLEERT